MNFHDTYSQANMSSGGQIRLTAMEQSGRRSKAIDNVGQKYPRTRATRAGLLGLMTLANGSTARKTSFRLTPEMSERIDELARRGDCRPSDVIRTAIGLFLDPRAMADHIAQIVAEADPCTAVTNGQRSIPDASEGHTDPSLSELGDGATIGVVSLCDICDGLLNTSSLGFNANGDFTGRCSHCKMRTIAKMVEFSDIEEPGP